MTVPGGPWGAPPYRYEGGEDGSRQDVVRRGRHAAPDDQAEGEGTLGSGLPGTGRWTGPDTERADGMRPDDAGASGWGRSGPDRTGTFRADGAGTGAWPRQGEPRQGMDQTAMFAPDGILGDRSSATGRWPSAPEAPARDPAPESRPPPALPHPGRATVRRRRRRRKLLEWPILVVVSLVSAFLIRTFVLQSYYIPSASMRDTLVEGDHVVVNKLSYQLHGIGRGDVVVFSRPPNLRIEDDDLIKRVIGLPGETVEAHDAKVYVDGRALTEPYVRSECDGTEDFLAVTVPADDIFVMGDNRCDSKDSRSFGPISTDLVVGRAFLRYWPVGRFGLL